MLLAAAREGGPFRGLDGAARAMLYLTATNTGLRKRELASLTPADFDFESPMPTVTVAAGYSKHRRTDIQPLREDVAAELQDWLSGHPCDKRCFPGSWPDRAAEMLRGDLRQARVDYEDEAGRVFDFHSLRHHFITNLARSGVHPSVAMKLARHSTIDLTMDNYTHVELEQMASALETTKDVCSDPEPDGGEKELVQGLVHQLVQTAGSDGLQESSHDTDQPSNPSGSEKRKRCPEMMLDIWGNGMASVESGTPDRARNCDLRFRKPML